jgi:long-chain acyl-CoA synthetase
VANEPKDYLTAHGTWKTAVRCNAGRQRQRTVEKYGTKEVAATVNNLGAGLLSLGISPNDMTVAGRDKVAILCKNRPEWLMLDLAVQQIGAILVPIYPTINVNELEFVLNDAQVKLVFVNDEDLFLKVLSLKERVRMKEIYTFEHAECQTLEGRI